MQPAETQGLLEHKAQLASRVLPDLKVRSVLLELQDLKVLWEIPGLLVRKDLQGL